MDDTKTGKPFPSHIGDLYLFSLSSYDPVQIEVVVPRVTEVDIDYAIEATLDSMGLGNERLTDALVAEKLENATPSPSCARSPASRSARPTCSWSRARRRTDARPSSPSA